MPDTIRPYITKTVPAVNASGYSVTAPLYVQFNERMNESTINTSSVALLRDPLVVTPIAAISYNDGLRMVTIVPSGDLTVASRYSLVVYSTVQDVAGNSMSNDYTVNFWTNTPSGYAVPTTPQIQPEAIVIDGNLAVSRTQPTNYSTNMSVADINPVRIYFNDTIAIGNRNYFGDGTSPNPMVIGNGFFEEPTTSIAGYVSVDNMEVLGDPYVSSTPPTLTYSIKGSFVEINMEGLLYNNEYLVTVRNGLEGLNSNPLVEDYQFVFTSTYTPLYAGYNIVRLRIGPMLQMAMAWVPNDTLNRFIYDASKEANRLHPTPIDPNNPPWYVVEFVIYQGTLNALYASLTLFAASGAGVRKQLADLLIEKDARGLMPAITPIIEDLRKLRDEFLIPVKNGNQYTTGAAWARKGQYDPRRPIQDASWRRLPLRNLQRGSQPQYEVSEHSDRNSLQWIYTYDLTGDGPVPLNTVLAAAYQGGMY
jgi:hypothetical protein